MAPGQHQAIIETNAGLLLFGPLGTNVSEILIGIQIALFNKMHLKMASGKLLPFCFNLNVLMLAYIGSWIWLVIYWLYKAYMMLQS